ncbi:hypothetical protein Y032_0122g1034 [Ancylostoma ceylanicum]|uniref:Clc-like protein n=1 Tax=Ancylostoma ceylanicum TaxID=53326 RepID=A0A016T9V4_9BILA|nr:hypothetical protein Y032_0122g1034 [Ancylostoma ceylanicum]
MCIFSSCGQIVFGGIMLLCLALTGTATFYGSEGRLVSWDCITNHRCYIWESRYEGGMRTVAIFMVLAFTAEVICLIWNLVTFCACCWKRYIIHPLILLSFLATVFLAVAVIVYAVTYNENIGYNTYQQDEYGFAFWLAVAALILAGIDVIVAGLTVCLGERGL